jgi:hypothetical protein
LLNEFSLPHHLQNNSPLETKASFFTISETSKSSIFPLTSKSFSLGKTLLRMIETFSLLSYLPLHHKAKAGNPFQKQFSAIGIYLRRFY